ncbi:olfactory receptor 5P64-like [Anomaloglossus baeobatrachus]|uniref:olfactory receptor 5P64-like n=1 Tax=Anomaloglossus baeobatrachus TaxID=238106 RepID=UPI003F4F5AC4
MKVKGEFEKFSERSSGKISSSLLTSSILVFSKMNIKSHNFSELTEIMLLGFQSSPGVNLLIFLLLLVIYCVTICVNLLVILVVSSSRSLHSPMYFFLTQLSFSDILLSTTIMPTMLHVVLCEGSSVSFVGCLTQFYLFAASETLECLLLTVMSYDRYQAICNPLHYALVVDLKFCLKVIILFWIIVFLVVFMFSLTMSFLDFCGPNIIDHFFCDLDPILELSCSDTFIVKMEDVILFIPLAISPFTIIMVSYVYIITTILRIPSVTGRQKTFSTCSSHLTVVSLFYLSLFTIYLFPSEGTRKKILSLFYTVFTPLLNPIIYSLSNKEIKQAIGKLLRIKTSMF